MATIDLIAKSSNGSLAWYQHFIVSDPNDLHADLEDYNDSLVSALADLLTDASIEPDWLTTESVSQILRFNGKDDLIVKRAIQAGLTNTDSLRDCANQMRNLSKLLNDKADQIDSIL